MLTRMVTVAAPTPRAVRPAQARRKTAELLVVVVAAVAEAAAGAAAADGSSMRAEIRTAQHGVRGPGRRDRLQSVSSAAAAAKEEVWKGCSDAGGTSTAGEEREETKIVGTFFMD